MRGRSPLLPGFGPLIGIFACSALRFFDLALSLRGIDAFGLLGTVGKHDHVVIVGRSTGLEKSSGNDVLLTLRPGLDDHETGHQRGQEWDVAAHDAELTFGRARDDQVGLALPHRFFGSDDRNLHVAGHLAPRSYSLSSLALACASSIPPTM